MFDWNNDNLSSLYEIAHETALVSELRFFSDYCLQEAGGHEKEAFASLELFLNETRHWKEETKRNFVDWLMRLQHKHPSLTNIIHPTLEHELVDPTLKYWRKENPMDPRHMRWSDDIEVLEQARKLAPDDEVIKRRLVDKLLRRIEKDCGHLPEDYPGHPDTDIALLDEIIEIISGLQQHTAHDKRMLELAHHLKEQILDMKKPGKITVIDVPIPDEDL